jgi:hypothetical protein
VASNRASFCLTSLNLHRHFLLTTSSTATAYVLLRPFRATNYRHISSSHATTFSLISSHQNRAIIVHFTPPDLHRRFRPTASNRVTTESGRTKSRHCLASQVVPPRFHSVAQKPPYHSNLISPNRVATFHFRLVATFHFRLVATLHFRLDAGFASSPLASLHFRSRSLASVQHFLFGGCGGNEMVVPSCGYSPPAFLSPRFLQCA